MLLDVYEMQMLYCLDTEKSSQNKRVQCDPGVMLQLCSDVLSSCWSGDRLGLI